MERFRVFIRHTRLSSHSFYTRAYFFNFLLLSRTPHHSHSHTRRQRQRDREREGTTRFLNDLLVVGIFIINRCVVVRKR